MTSSDSASPSIRPASTNDLPALYALAEQALTLDSFSQELLAEKLFRNPNPERNEYHLYAAELDGALVGFMQGVVRPEESKGWVGLFAVDQAVRRGGIASALLRRLGDDFRQANLPEVEVLTIPGNYFTPGIDPRYTPAVCFLERSGFERYRDCVNLTAHLDDAFDTSAEERRLAADGIDIRRATPADDELLNTFFAEQFGPDWRAEVELARQNNPPGLHLAIKEGRIIAFSAHSAQNREWGYFGPMGTAPAARGHGLGRVLLWHCLNDLGAAGHRTSVIPWVGPIAFYQQWCAAVVDRVFWRYRLKLTPGAGQ